MAIVARPDGNAGSFAIRAPGGGCASTQRGQLCTSGMGGAAAAQGHGAAAQRRRVPAGRGASERTTATRPAATGTGTAAARAPQRPAPRLWPAGRVRAKAMKTRVRPLPDAGRHAERGRGGLEHRQGRHHRLGQARVQDRGRRRRIMDRLRNSSCDSLGMEAWSRSAPSCALASHNSRLAVTHAPSLCLQSRKRRYAGLA